MLADKAVQTILADYDKSCDGYVAFTAKLDHLVREIVGHSTFNAHSITSRVKERLSLEKKLKREDVTYESLTDVTDLSGVRITTYFHDDVDKIAKLIHEEFEIIPEHSIDKRSALDPDRFGYLSLHYVVKLPKKRTALTEYKRFPSLLCEIQIRSILQHAWAEIEHDLGYKTQREVPKDIRRQFSRLAGLLELADEEFANIRRKLECYSENLSDEIKKRPEEVGLDKLSLEEFVSSNPIVVSIDNVIAKCFGASIIPGLRNPDFDLQMLRHCGIETVGELEKELAAKEKIIDQFARAFLAGCQPYKAIHQGISLFYLSYVLLAERETKIGIREALMSLNIGRDSIDQANNAKKIIECYAAIQGKPATSPVVFPPPVV